MNSISEEFKKYIKAVGTGPKGNRDLSEAESIDAMNFLLSGELADAQIAAFLLGLRLKPETNEEYRGALAVLLNKSRRPELNSQQKTFELGFPFDGKNDAPYLFPLTAKILKEYGVKIIVCGDEKVPSKDGVTVKEIMSKLGSTENVSYYDRSEYLPELSRLSTIRNQLGLRTALNTLEKFSGIEKSSYGATGVFHKPYVQKYAEIFKDQMDCFSLVSSNEGSPELCKKGKIYISKNEAIEEISVDPGEFGIALPPREHTWTLKEMVQVITEPEKIHWQLAALNAALYLYTAQEVSDWRATFQKLATQYS